MVSSKNKYPDSLSVSEKNATDFYGRISMACWRKKIGISYNHRFEGQKL